MNSRKLQWRQRRSRRQASPQSLANSPEHAGGACRRSMPAEHAGGACRRRMPAAHAGGAALSHSGLLWVLRVLSGVPAGACGRSALTGPNLEPKRRRVGALGEFVHRLVRDHEGFVGFERRWICDLPSPARLHISTRPPTHLPIHPASRKNALQGCTFCLDERLCG